MTNTRRRMSKCQICSETYCRKDGGNRSPICPLCFSETAMCEICGLVMPKYAKKNIVELRHTCSQKCHNTRVARMPHVREISSRTAKATYERQKNKPEYMKWLKDKGNHLSEFHANDFKSKSSERGRARFNDPEFYIPWHKSQLDAWTDKRREKISDAHKKLHQDPVYHARISELVARGNRTAEARKNHSEAAKKAYADGKYDHVWSNYIYTRRTNLERIVELVLCVSNIPYIRNQRVWRYYIDFTIPEFMVGIEADGAYWHSDRQEEDAKRDAYLASRGWTIIRLSEKEIKDDVVDALSRKVIPILESALSKNQTLESKV